MLPTELVEEVLDSSSVPLVTRPVAVVPGCWRYSAVALGVWDAPCLAGSVSGPLARRMSYRV